MAAGSSPDPLARDERALTAWISPSLPAWISSRSAAAAGSIRA